MKLFRRITSLFRWFQVQDQSCPVNPSMKNGALSSSLSRWCFFNELLGHKSSAEEEKSPQLWRHKRRVFTPWTKSVSPKWVSEGLRGLFSTSEMFRFLRFESRNQLSKKVPAFICQQMDSCPKVSGCHQAQEGSSRRSIWRPKSDNNSWIIIHDHKQTPWVTLLSSTSNESFQF